MEVIIVLFIMALPVSFINISWESHRERRYLTETAALFQQYLSSHKLKATYLNETRKIAVTFGEKSRACHQVSAARCDDDPEGFTPMEGVRIVSGTTGTVLFWGTRIRLCCQLFTGKYAGTDKTDYLGPGPYTVVHAGHDIRSTVMLNKRREKGSLLFEMLAGMAVSAILLVTVTRFFRRWGRMY